MNKKNIPYIIGIILLAVLIVIIWPKKSKAEKAFLEKHHLNGLSFEEMVEYLDNNIDEKTGFKAAINGKTLMLSDSNNQFTYELPKNKFYLSIAPYINDTHPCSNHNLVTCRGELVNKTISVLVTDTSGKVIVDDEYTSGDNGFFGIWLPKNMKGNISVTYQGKTASAAITTYADSNTCLTTLELK